MTPQALVICPVIGLLVLFLALRNLERRERRLVVLAFAAHVLASVAVVVYHEHVFGGGDMLVYYAAFGREIAYVLSVDLTRWGPDVVKLALQLDNDFPVTVILPGTATGTMSAVTGMLMYVVGDTMYGVCLLVALFSFWGSVSLYRAVRWCLKPNERVPALVGILLIPSVVFWTSGMLKEALVMGFMGMVCKAIADLLAHRKIVAVVPLLIGMEGIAVTKPYVLFALVVAVGAWIYAGRGQRLRFMYKVAAAVLVIGGVLLVARRFPEFSPDNLADSVSRNQRNYNLVVGGGSNIQLGDTDDAPASLAGHLKWAPLGLLNSLARPFLFEVRNVTMGIAALEITALLIGVFQLLRRHGVRRVAREITTSPPLLFAAVLVLSFGTSVGLATRNLGTLSRYRVPMMPMYAACVLVLRARLDVRRRVTAPSGATKGAPRGAFARPRSVVARAALARIGAPGGRTGGGGGH